MRLYSGPCYMPINTFLRQIAGLTGGFRREVARNAGLTFAATTRHLVHAIRKLAAATPDAEACSELWRGVRGELPRAFWLPDAAGDVCAVDMAFMSTSRDKATPVAYMASGGPNVLWGLKPHPESDDGFHRGADISMLSQFAGEREVLFPPCTMLKVMTERSKDAGRSVRLADVVKDRMSGISNEDLNLDLARFAQRGEDQGKMFVEVNVLPTFV